MCDKYLLLNSTHMINQNITLAKEFLTFNSTVGMYVEIMDLWYCTKMISMIIENDFADFK